MDTGINRSETPLITPERLLAELKIDYQKKYRFKLALLSFMPIGLMAKKLKGKKVNRQIIPMATSQWVSRDGQAILVGPVYGGPVCAAVLEELSAFGVEYAIGYGLSGSLVENIRPKEIMIADAALCSDGTSKEYTRGSEVRPDSALLEMALSGLRDRKVEPKMGKVWTTDAIYRELPSKVAYWREQGAAFVNMEAAPFYAVARAKSIRAVFLSVVSDYVGGNEWSGWTRGMWSVINLLWEVCLNMAEEAVGSNRRRGWTGILLGKSWWGWRGFFT